MNFREKILNDIRSFVFNEMPNRYKNTQHPKDLSIGTKFAKFYVPKDESIGKSSRKFNNIAKKDNLISVFDIDSMSDENLYELFCWIIPQLNRRI